MFFEGLFARRRKKSYRSWLTFGPMCNIEEDLWGYLVVVFGVFNILDIKEGIVLDLFDQLFVESGHLPEIEREFTWIIITHKGKALLLEA